MNTLIHLFIPRDLTSHRPISRLIFLYLLLLLTPSIQAQVLQDSLRLIPEPVIEALGKMNVNDILPQENGLMWLATTLFAIK